MSFPVELLHCSHIVLEQVRIDANGTQSYFTFDAKEHPPMRPMAYASSGMANMMM